MTWILKNEVLLIDGRPVSLPGPAKYAVLSPKDILVVLLKRNSGPYGDRNVVGVNSLGQIIWQIKNNPPTMGQTTNPVSGIIEIDGQIGLYFWEGIKAVLDPVTGDYTIPRGQRPW